jgi:hypothetical protein
MCVCSPETLIRDKELPIINGRRIKSIYAMGFFSTTDKLVDAPVAGRIDCYICYTEDRDYKIVDGKSVWIDKPNVKLKELPDIFKPLFEKSTSLWYRMTDSCNGSFTDGSIYLKSGTVYRGIKYMQDAYGCIPVNSKLGKQALATLNSVSEVEELEESFGVQYDKTWLRRENDMWWPDMALPTWRPSGCYPYITQNIYNTDNIRVYYENWGKTLFLERVKEEVGDEGLVYVHFPREKGRDFCTIMTWADSKKEDPGGIVRFKVLDINEKDNWSIHVAAMLNDKVQFKEKRHGGSFYRLNRISN